MFNFGKNPTTDTFEGFKARTGPMFAQNSLNDKNVILKIIERFFETKTNKVMLVSVNGKKNSGLNFVKNLGGASSSLDKKTLLIDCDFIDSALTKSLDFKRSTIGLTNVLKDEDLVLDAISTVTPQLQILPVGSVVNEDQIILKFQKFKRIIDTYRGYYDLIVIMTTEKRDSFFSEVMYQSSDQVILSTPTNVEKKCDLKALQELIESQHSELMGVVFND